MYIKKPIKDIGVIDSKKNIFYADVEGERLLIVKQPKHGDVKAMEEARRQTSRQSWERYAPFSTLWESYPQLVEQPYFTRHDVGRFHMIMKVGDEVVGFASQDYSHRGEGRAVFTALCVVDHWQRMGVGTVFLLLSEYIGCHLGARRGVAQTRIRSGLGTFRLRQRTGWRETRHYIRQNREWSEMEKHWSKSLEELREELLEISRRISG